MWFIVVSAGATGGYYIGILNVSLCSELVCFEGTSLAAGGLKAVQALAHPPRPAYKEVHPIGQPRVC